jgi:HprK-related kinase A
MTQLTTTTVGRLAEAMIGERRGAMAVAPGVGGSPMVRRCFRIGVVEVAVSSEAPGVLAEFRELYRDFETPHVVRPVEISVHRVNARYGFGRRYLINGGGEKMFTVKEDKELLPHVEWAVNWQIVRQLAAYLQVHAGVVERNGNGFIFPGTPGSGKTTLCAGLISRGWRYLCDEFALIDEEGDLHPYPKALCVKQGSFDVMARLDLPRLCPRQYKKGRKGLVTYLGPTELKVDVNGRPCPLRYVVFPAYTQGAEPRLTPIPRGEAVFLLRQLTFNFQDFGQEALRILTRSVQRARCYRLVSGDIHATCDVMEQLANGHGSD